MHPPMHLEAMAAMHHLLLQVCLPVILMIANLYACWEFLYLQLLSILHAGRWSFHSFTVVHNSWQLFS